MNIKEVAKHFELTADTLRYYERIGLIPPVTRNESGHRDYSDEDLNWVHYIKCMRAAGISVETLTKYVALFQQGDETIHARKQLLIEQREQLIQKLATMRQTLAKLDYKLDGYEERMLSKEKQMFYPHEVEVK